MCILNICIIGICERNTFKGEKAYFLGLRSNIDWVHFGGPEAKWNIKVVGAWGDSAVHWAKKPRKHEGKGHGDKLHP